MRKPSVNYRDARVRREVLIRQRRGIWTPEQIESLARHFRLRPGMRLLDAGCGYGYAMRTWGRYCMPGGKLVGLDRDKKLLATAKRFCRSEGLSDSCEFVQGDVCSLPFKENTLNMVLAHVVFCHLDQPEKALDEMVRVAEPGGCIAVFDNAAAAGRENSWQNWQQPTRRESLLQFEFTLSWIRGRAKLGQGDLSVGCYIPGWMEERGLEHVGVRMNERVRWFAPPYRSEEQQLNLQNTRERLRASRRMSWPDKEERARLRAGGLTDRKTDSIRELMLRDNRLLRKAVKAGTASQAWSMPFWCIWGFKP